MILWQTSSLTVYTSKFMSFEYIFPKLPYPKIDGFPILKYNELSYYLLRDYKSLMKSTNSIVKNYFVKKKDVVDLIKFTEEQI